MGAQRGLSLRVGGLGRLRVLDSSHQGDVHEACWDPLLEVVAFGRKGKKTATDTLLQRDEGGMGRL